MPRGTVQITTLGNNGRFGNQLSQYCFARAYAEKYGAVLEIPEDWIGRKIFNVDHPSISHHLPRMQLDYVPWGHVNIDLFGYFQNQHCLDIQSKSKIHEWLKFRPEIIESLNKIILPKQPYVAIHRRLGDYLRLIDVLCIPTPSSYFRAVSKFGYKVSDSIIVTEESPTKCDLPDEISFLGDFYVLMNATALFRANSTFSWWAAVLGNPEKVYSPIVEGKYGHCDVEFVEGNHPIMISQRTSTHTDLFLPE